MICSRGKGFLLLIAVFAALFCLASNQSCATVLTLHDGESAEYDFHFTEPPATVFGPVNFLSYTGFGGLNTSAQFDIRISLYNGDHLLGSLLGHSLFQMWAAFKDASSGYNFFQTANVDFSSIADGSIEGRLIFEAFFPNPDASQPDPAFSFEITPYTGKQDQPDTGFYSGGVPVIDAAFIRPAQNAVPEPSTYALAASVCLFGLALYRRKSR